MPRGNRYLYKKQKKLCTLLPVVRRGILEALLT